MKVAFFLIISLFIINCEDGSVTAPVEEEKVNTALLISNPQEDNSGCDYLIITHEDFINPALKLAEYRRVSELDDVEDPKVITTKMIDSLITDKIKLNITAQTIKDFIIKAQTNWNKKPKYTVLFADAQIKPRLYTGIPNPDSSNGSDHYYADLDDSLYYDIILGRVPVSTLEEAEGYVKKIKRYESNPPKSLIAITDDQWNGDYKDMISFSTSTEMLTTHLDTLPYSNLNLNEFNFSSFGDTDTSKLTIEQRELAALAFIDSLNKENQIVNYFGHASPEMIAGNVFSYYDIPQLKTIDLWVSMGCHTNYYKAENSFAKKLIQYAEGGAIAVIGSYLANYSVSGLQNISEFYNQMYNNSDNRTLGDAFFKIIRYNRRTVPNSTLMFLGDPAIPIF